MADTALANLTASGALDGTELVYGAQSGGDVKITTAKFKTLTSASPTLVTPVLGVATATSINGLTISSSTGTFTLTNGKTLAVTHSITFAGTDSTTMTFPATSATIARTDAAQTFTGAQTLTSPIINGVTHTTATAASIGYLGIPSGSKSAAYTTVLSDAGKSILHALADDNARTFTIDSNANVAYPVDTVLTFINLKNTLTIAITSDTMTLANSATTGTRTLAANGIATAIKVGTTSWLISGTGLT